jgi:predicted YcjX-like family ATPase
MVEAFMEGIDPGCQEVVKSFWRTIMAQFPQDVANSVTSINAAQQGALVKKLSKAGRRILDQFDQKLRAYVQERHIDPVVDAVAVLPKDLLAEVAESLVNLTSFKRRISMTSAETVGGPIDVAVISRGDGFVWIKRKHYFRAELNPQFMSQYSGGLYGRPKTSKT